MNKIKDKQVQTLLKEHPITWREILSLWYNDFFSPSNYNTIIEQNKKLIRNYHNAPLFRSKAEAFAGLKFLADFERYVGFRK